MWRLPPHSNGGNLQANYSARIVCVLSLPTVTLVTAFQITVIYKFDYEVWELYWKSSGA